jgi:putative flippase GtrA
MKHVPVQFLKFAVVGVSNTLIAYGVYALCIFLGLPYLIANAIGFFIFV